MIGIAPRNRQRGRGASAELGATVERSIAVVDQQTIAAHAAQNEIAESILVHVSDGEALLSPEGVPDQLVHAVLVVEVDVVGTEAAQARIDDVRSLDAWLEIGSLGG